MYSCHVSISVTSDSILFCVIYSMQDGPQTLIRETRLTLDNGKSWSGNTVYVRKRWIRTVWTVFKFLILPAQLMQKEFDHRNIYACLAGSVWFACAAVQICARYISTALRIDQVLETGGVRRSTKLQHAWSSIVWLYLAKQQLALWHRINSETSQTLWRMFCLLIFTWFSMKRVGVRNQRELTVRGGNFSHRGSSSELWMVVFDDLPTERPGETCHSCISRQECSRSYFWCLIFLHTKQKHY